MEPQSLIRIILGIPAGLGFTVLGFRGGGDVSVVWFQEFPGYRRYLNLNLPKPTFL